MGLVAEQLQDAWPLVLLLSALIVYASLIPYSIRCAAQGGARGGGNARADGADALRHLPLPAGAHHLAGRRLHDAGAGTVSALYFLVKHCIRLLLTRAWQDHLAVQSPASADVLSTSWMHLYRSSTTL